MLKESVTYVNFNGEKKVKDLYFNLSKTEIIDMIAKDLFDPEDFERISKEENPKELFQVFTWLVELSYGEKSEDGEFFDKDPALFSRFKASAVYDALIMRITSSENEALNFFKGVFPKDLLDAAMKEISSKDNSIGVVPFPQNSTPMLDQEPIEQSQQTQKVQDTFSAPISREEYEALIARLNGVSHVELNSDHIRKV